MSENRLHAECLGADEAYQIQHQNEDQGHLHLGKLVKPLSRLRAAATNFFLVFWGVFSTSGQPAVERGSSRHQAAITVSPRGASEVFRFRGHTRLRS